MEHRGGQAGVGAAAGLGATPAKSDLRLRCASTRKEFFGPVASVIRVTNDVAAVATANDTELGLSSMGLRLSVFQRPT
ncbi:MAG: aldehyde dehydrogenase family protein [Variovorax sp.]|nr:MAG: aldehyde dehydrogenase family protein [Variovorax sp.]